MEKESTALSLMKVLNRNRPYHGYANGAICEEILFTFIDSNNVYQIEIRAENYEDQSYARLNAWTEHNGFSAIINKRPQKHYNINAAYKYKENEIPHDIFSTIIEDLAATAMDFDRTARSAK